MYRLAIACNDYRNGNFVGKAESIHITDDSGDGLHLVGDRPLSILVDKPRYLKVGHTVLRMLGYSRWVGSWCWDEAAVSSKDLAKIANYLRKRGWHCEGGYVELSEKWDLDQPFVAADFAD